MPEKTASLQPIGDVNRLMLIQERIKEYIIANELGPGDRLPTEEQLAEMLRVSRTAIREAYRSLEALGIVEARQGVGRVVRDFNFDPILNSLSYGLAFHNRSISQAHEIRKALELYILEAAIAHVTEADLTALSACVAQMRADADKGIVVFRKADYQFHRLLFQRGGNPLALQLFEITWRVADAGLNQDWSFKEVPAGLADEHAAIADAIARGDVAAAQHATIRHYQSVEQRLRGLTEPPRTAPGAAASGAAAQT